jgi:hypothetical protein
LFLIASLLWRSYVISTISDTFPWGFPVQFYLAWGPCPPGESCSEFNGLWLFLDILIWYVVSTFIIHTFKKKSVPVEKEMAK